MRHKTTATQTTELVTIYPTKLVDGTTQDARANDRTKRGKEIEMGGPVQRLRDDFRSTATLGRHEYSHDLGTVT